MGKRYYFKMGTKVKQQRVRYCLTEEELCSMLPLNVNIYKAYEAGTMRIPEYDLYILAEFYGIESTEFMPTFKECQIFWSFDKNTGFQLVGNDKYSYDKRNTPRLRVELNCRTSKMKGGTK